MRVHAFQNIPLQAGHIVDRAMLHRIVWHRFANSRRDPLRKRPPKLPYQSARDMDCPMNRHLPPCGLEHPDMGWWAAALQFPVPTKPARIPACEQPSERGARLPWRTFGERVVDRDELVQRPSDAVSNARGVMEVGCWLPSDLPRFPVTSIVHDLFLYRPLLQ